VSHTEHTIEEYRKFLCPQCNLLVAAGLGGGRVMKQIDYE